MGTQLSLPLTITVPVTMPLETMELLQNAGQSIMAVFEKAIEILATSKQEQVVPEPEPEPEFSMLRECAKNKIGNVRITIKQTLIDIVRKHPGLTHKQIAEKTALMPCQVQNNLYTLRHQGILKNKFHNDKNLWFIA